MKKLLKEFVKFKTHDDEKFKFVKYPNVNKYQYVISNYGKIFNFLTTKQKKCYIDKDGYHKTSISMTLDNGEKCSRNVFIHRLVAYTFLKKDKCRKLVNHKDGNKKNNYYKNLEWVTPAENTQHAISHHLQCNSGVNCPSAIYDEKLVRKICSLLEQGFDNHSVYITITGEKTIQNRAIYALIYSIQRGTRHREIRSEYNIPDRVKSKSKPQFTKEETEKIKLMINEGYSSSDIIKEFGEKTTRDKKGKRIYDKIQNIKKSSQGKRSTTIENIS